MKLYCGDTLCKSPVEANPGAVNAWPVRCQACGTSLYPSDVLARLPAADLEPKRATLMREEGGRRVAFQASSHAAPKGGDAETLDRIFSMVDTGDDPAGSRLPPAWILAAVGLALVALIAWLVFGR